MASLILQSTFTSPLPFLENTRIGRAWHVPRANTRTHATIHSANHAFAARTMTKTRRFWQNRVLTVPTTTRTRNSLPVGLWICAFATQVTQETTERNVLPVGLVHSRVCVEVLSAKCVPQASFQISQGPYKKKGPARTAQPVLFKHLMEPAHAMSVAQI